MKDLFEPSADERRLSDRQFAERAERLYHNGGYAERACDHCGALYQGPAMYCSLACATADA